MSILFIVGSILAIPIVLFSVSGVLIFTTAGVLSITDPCFKYSINSTINYFETIELCKYYKGNKDKMSLDPDNIKNKIKNNNIIIDENNRVISITKDNR